MFFPSLPFMGVMLFPSFRLGNASGRGGSGASFVPTPLLLYLSSFLFISFFSLPPQLSHLLLLLTAFSSVPIFFPLFFSSYHTPLPFFFSFMSFSLVPFFFFFFFLRELLVLCALRELLVLCALRELLVLCAF